MHQAPNNNPANVYDYIICGAGCAGLSLLVHLIRSNKFSDKKILVIDKDAKRQNDRTWCFWEHSPGMFQSIVRKEWNELSVSTTNQNLSFSILPYRYKLIRGLDFYNHCMELLSANPNIKFLQTPVEKIEQGEGLATVAANGETFRAQYVFNSILFGQPPLQEKEYWLKQHFKGWFIKTEKPAVDPHRGRLMDFRTSQKEGTTFFYVLPFSATEALVEYTLFSKELLPDERYETALKDYVERELNLSNYEILEKEFGIIPMTNHRFAKGTKNIVNIGTAGGFTKGSSGYTFQFIQKSSAAIVKNLSQKKSPMAAMKPSPKFHFFDTVLLYILAHRKLNGADIFEDLFRKNDPRLVLKFLDNETSLKEDLKIISSLPTLPFLKAAIRSFTF